MPLRVWPVAVLAVVLISWPEAPPVALRSGLDVAAITQWSTRLDALVDARLARLGRAAPPVASDNVFLRRAWLDLAGRGPTRAEAEVFLTDSAPQRRARLIDGLVSSPAYLSRQFNWWADLLRVQSRLQDRLPGQPWAVWLKEQLAANTPYDRLVTAMLTATGPALAPGNGATGWRLRDAGMPLDHLAITMRTFLGTDFGCAQCHDHPYEKWTRLEFYQLAAYDHGVDLNKSTKGLGNGKQLKEKVANEPPEVRNMVRELTRGLYSSVSGNGDGKITLPVDWKQDGGAPGDSATAAVPFGTSPATTSKHTAAAFAAWVTAPDNPRFARLIANRMWQQAFGTGLIEPIDRFGDDAQGSEPALLSAVAELVVASGFDLQVVQRVLRRTNAYGRAAVDDSEPVLPRRRALTAEQVWDSLAVMVEGAPERQAATSTAATDFYAQHQKLDADELLDLAKTMVDARSDQRQVRKQLDQARRKGPKADIPALEARLAKLEATADPLDLRPDGPGGAVRRASDLPQPAPPGHPMRVLGQSDRLLPDNGSTAPTVPQALLLLNGLVDNAVLRADVAMAKDLDAAPSEAERVRRAFRWILVREPTAAELGVLGPGPRDRRAWADVVWALINHTEFRFLP